MKFLDATLVAIPIDDPFNGKYVQFSRNGKIFYGRINYDGNNAKFEATHYIGEVEVDLGGNINESGLGATYYRDRLYKKNVKYKGFFRDRRFITGIAKIYYRNNELSEEEILNLSHSGSKEYSDLFIQYSGEYKNERYEGDGIYYINNNGEVYRGNFKASKFEGRGILYYNFSTLTDDEIRNLEAIGAKDQFGYIKYSGEWKNDEYEGEGILYYRDGQFFYKGQFVADLREGQGMEYYNSSTLTDDEKTNLDAAGAKDQFGGYISYSGEFKNDKIQGEGSLYFKDGEFYKGQFVAGLREGRGIEYYNPSILTDDEKTNLEAAGAKDRFGYILYSGEWKNGLFDEGRGIKYYNVVNLSEQEKINLLQAEAKDSFGYILYSGEFKNGLFDGEGILYFKDGQFYKGQFVAGLREGRGIEYLKNGQFYKGQFVSDKYVSNVEVREPIVTRGAKRKMEASIK